MPPEPFTVRLRTLTPLWTGDADGQCTRLLESGILGSIRWWCEALIRALGGTACNPADKDNRCPDQRGRICDACAIFGCTGWRRLFRLQIRPIGQLDRIPRSRIVVQPVRGRGQWFIDPGWYGSWELRLVPMRDPEWDKDGLWFELVKAALWIAVKYGSLGARDQFGYGFVDFIDPEQSENCRQAVLSAEEAVKALTDRKREVRRKNIPDHISLPTLARFSSYQFTLQKWDPLQGLQNYIDQRRSGNAFKEMVIKAGIAPCVPLLRYHLRALLRQNNNDVERHRLLGKILEGHNKASCVNFSFAYGSGTDWTCRIWVWLPDKVGRWKAARCKSQLERWLIPRQEEGQFPDDAWQNWLYKKAELSCTTLFTCCDESGVWKNPLKRLKELAGER